MELPINYNEAHWSIRREVREAYMKLQDGKCYHCGGLLTEKSLDKRIINKALFPKGMFNYPVHLHHNHETGMTIGAVHAHCNAVLWQYENK